MGERLKLSGVLRGARALLEDGWAEVECDGYRWPVPTARRPEGDEMVVCDWDHPEACEFGLSDALCRAAKTEHGDQWAGAAVQAEEELRMMAPGLSVCSWAAQQGRTKREVLALLDRAIARVSRIEATEAA